MVYRTDVTVDSADELSTPKFKHGPTSFDSFLECADNCETARRTLSASSARCAELEPQNSPSSKKQKRSSPGSPSTSSSQRTGVRWVIGSISRRNNCQLDGSLQSQEPYFADLDDSESDLDVDEMTIKEYNSVCGSALEKNEAQKPCFMLRNPIFDCHTGVFGMAIGDESYKSDDWGPYSYHLLSKMHQRGPRPGFAASLLN